MKGIVKTGLWSFIMCLTYSFQLFAQNSRGRSEQIEAIKVAFITNKLDLTSKEAQRFWPIYNNYQKEWMELMKKRRAARSKKDMDADEKINASLEYESKMLDLKKKYKKLYIRAIPAEKILELYEAERDFREHLIRQLKIRRRSSDN